MVGNEMHPPRPGVDVLTHLPHSQPFKTFNSVEMQSSSTSFHVALLAKWIFFIFMTTETN